MKFTNGKIFKLILLFGLSCALASPLAAQTKKRIINGADSTVNWPWMASLSAAGTQPSRSHFCGGVVVDTRYVLTAAHCLEDLATTPEGIQVFIGKANLTDPNGIITTAQGVIIHPDYDINTEQNDIALIRLTDEVDASHVLPLLSPAEESTLPVETDSLVLGWGTTDARFGVHPSILQQAQIPLINQSNCQDRIGLDFDPQTMICAGILSSSSNAGDGVDSCIGDSGGPLLVDTPEGYKLLGLVSWGLVCASEKYWGVYTRVPTFFDWVKNSRTISPNIVAAPTISGLPKVNSKLSCDVGVYGGDAPDKIKVSFSDADTGQLLKNGSSYRIVKSDIGRNIICNVALSNLGGSLSTQSDSIGPIFPESFAASLKIRKGSTLIQAGVSCNGGKCLLLMEFKSAQSNLRVLLEKSQTHCRLNSCPPDKWKNSQKLTPEAWAISLPSNWHGYRRLLIRSVERKKYSKFSEAAF